MADTRAMMLTTADQVLEGSADAEDPVAQAIFVLVWSAAHLAWRLGGPSMMGTLTAAMANAVLIELAGEAPPPAKLN